MTPRLVRRIVRSSAPLAVAVAALLAACSPDSSISAPQSPPAAPKALLGLDPLVGGLTSTLTTTTSGIPVVGGTVNLLGDVVDGLLVCSTQSTLRTSKYIGPYGGTISVGNHQLVIPTGALSSTVLITATQQSGNVAEVDFQPHGLKFAKPAALTLSYSSCSAPAGSVQSIVYVNEYNQIVEAPPSVDNTRSDNVAGFINHFSGYAIATRTPSGE
jgi:hypothetical protein